MAEDRKSGKLKNIEPDSKSQVTFEYIDGQTQSLGNFVFDLRSAQSQMEFTRPST
jgi:S-adenosylmethionine synthetase